MLLYNYLLLKDCQIQYFQAHSIFLAHNQQETFLNKLQYISHHYNVEHPRKNHVLFSNFQFLNRYSPVSAFEQFLFHFLRHLHHNHHPRRIYCHSRNLHLLIFFDAFRHFLFMSAVFTLANSHAFVNI